MKNHKLITLFQKSYLIFICNLGNMIPMTCRYVFTVLEQYVCFIIIACWAEIALAPLLLNCKVTADVDCNSFCPVLF